MYEYLIGENEEEGVSLFPVVPTDRTRGDGHGLKYMRFHLTQQYPFFPPLFFFTVRVVKHWNRLSREVVESFSMEVLKTEPHMVLGDLF